jgi:hypothetical protein
MIVNVRATNSINVARRKLLKLSTVDDAFLNILSSALSEERVPGRVLFTAKQTLEANYRLIAERKMSQKRCIFAPEGEQGKCDDIFFPSEGII